METQAVYATDNDAGRTWWELRDPAGSAVAAGVEDTFSRARASASTAASDYYARQ